ncbi:Na+/H+ antiporter subunit G [Acinetobacter qingfengensis]|uniref:Na+/H+ antiporter subunit G n=1 Tax=Acinetobacter qingfengensis TaxID=1262585 RepID=A0A1E7RDW8_9GAMM|nr:Na+/H+ antiporter subunit G [Acinetobacter qingfengensis]KAA8733711.1 Na+/H+ antiporter subunit G [Acinetobacter qingfengensis]OEY97473.1 Na+/H+ antiporter subunit G [Acinetobacter qingfengensis]
MQLLMEILVAFFLLTGAFFLFVGGVGMIRLPDLFMRLHAPTKASTLGLGSFLIASIIYSAFHGRFGFPELLITLLAFITAPVSANLLAQAAIHLNLRSRSGDVPEALNRPLPWQKIRRPVYKNTRNQKHPELTPKEDKDQL